MSFEGEDREIPQGFAQGAFTIEVRACVAGCALTYLAPLFQPKLGARTNTRALRFLLPDRNWLV